MSDGLTGALSESIILAGGLATRLGDIASATPKCLQIVAGRPFIDHLLWDVRRHGVRRVVLATGRLHERVEAHVGDGSAFGVEVIYSREDEPLGTAGALGLASRHLESDAALVLNGDSLIGCNYLDLALARARTGADVAIALREVDDVSRFGRVAHDPASGLVASFGEKSATGPGFANAGAYVARADWLRALPVANGSLESGVFPSLAAERRLAGTAYDVPFVDIGTPEALGEAQSIVAAWRHKPCAFLDRDGVINEDIDYVHRPEDFRFMPGMPGAIKMLNDAGWLVIVITNQAGIGRGYYTEGEFAEFTRWIDGELARDGAHVDATYHCPHHPTAALGAYLTSCECRKPAPGMLLRAIAEWEPNVSRSFMLGDKPSDIDAATAAGVRAVTYSGGDTSALVASLIG